MFTRTEPALAPVHSSVRSPLTAARATFALNASECVCRILFVISSVPLPALSLAQAPVDPLIPLPEFAQPPLCAEIPLTSRVPRSMDSTTVV